MYQREFNKQLHISFPKAVLLYGDNDYLIDLYTNTYIKNLNAKESMSTLYHDEWDFNVAKSFLSQTSLFGGTNLLVVKHGKKIPKKELELLIELANKNADNYFVYAYSGASKDAYSMQSSFTDKKGGVWVRFFEPNLRDSIPILQQKAQKIGLNIDHYALQHLMLILNNNLALCANELDKLAILDMQITSKDIDRLVYSTAPLATEQLLIDLFNKKPIINSIRKVLEFGEDESSLIYSTQYFINQIFMFHIYTKLNGYVDSKEILGYRLPKQIEEQKAQLARRVSSIQFLKIFEHILESEIIIKKASATQREVLVYSMLIKLQSYL